MTTPRPAPPVESAEPGLSSISQGMRWLHRGATHRPVSYGRHQYPQVAVFLLLTVIVTRTQVESLSAMRDVNLWLVYSLTAVGFYWVFGLAGRFAFSHTFMMALGAFTSAFVARQGVSPWLGILAALLVTALAATLIGAACHRASDFYFAIATLAVSQVGAIVFVRAEGFTGPSGVVSGVPPLSSPWGDLVADTDVFWLLVLALGLVLVLAVWIDRSPLRRRLVAARDNPMVARSAGIPVGRLQLGFFALGSSVAGASGAIIGSWTGVVSNDTFGIDLAIGIFLMVVLGGLGSHWGAVAGAAFYVGVPHLLSGVAEYEAIIYSGVLLLTIILVPDGIIGASQRAISRVTHRWRPGEGNVEGNVGGNVGGNTVEGAVEPTSDRGGDHARDC